jgi:DNA-binding GntR family transcriptional regulator
MRSDNLSDEIAVELRRLIAHGALASGARINESELSRQLEVSRTPLREALSRLGSEGFVVMRARRGFFVQELRPAEVEELYRLRAILDPAALELAGLPSAAQLKVLTEGNRRIRDASGPPERIVDLDDAWHTTLLEHCPNRILLGLVRQHMLRTRPLECAYMAERGNVKVVVSEHDRIVRSLKRGDLDAAVEALRENMTSAIPVLVRWASTRFEGRRDSVGEGT